MARRRFFVEQVRNGEAEISGDEAQHLTRVLRVEVGQVFEISDNHRVWLAEVETARKQEVVFRIKQEIATRPLPVRLTLLAALIKFDRLEWMIEKATELGVETIIPVETVRSERGLDRAAEKRLARWRKIALESAQQSRRDTLPEVEDPLPLRDALAREFDCRYLLDEEESATVLSAALPPKRTPEERVAVLIGPEGGWTEAERAAALAAGWKPVSLGSLILRAETAATSALAIVGDAWRATASAESAPESQ